MCREDSDLTRTNTGVKSYYTFLAKRARPDMQLPVLEFLCTRVKEPTANNWKKLEHVMKYLRGIIGLPSLLLGIINDAGTFAVYAQ